MAASQSNHLNGNSNYSNKRWNVVHVIPLVCLKKTVLVKVEYIVIKCCSNPSINDSPTFDLPLPYFKTGTAEEYLRWKINLEKACVGQGCTNGTEKYAIARCLLQGDALAFFDQLEMFMTSQTSDYFNEVLRGVTNNVFPKQAAQTQKLFMWRFFKKTVERNTRAYVARIQEIKLILPIFPKVAGAEIEILQEDNLLDLHYFGMPAQWQHQMILQDFDPIDHSISSLFN